MFVVERNHIAMVERSSLIQLFRFAGPTGDWTQQELAEFYRVRAILAQCGLPVGCDKGLSDEGEPWFVFYRDDNNEVVVHIARIAHQYVVAAQAVSDVVVGRDLRQVVQSLLERPTYSAASRFKSGPSLMIHPAALLTALVAASYVHNLRALEMTGDAGDLERASHNSWMRQELAILSVVAVLTAWLEAASISPISVELAKIGEIDSQEVGHQVAAADGFGQAQLLVLERADFIESAKQGTGSEAFLDAPTGANVVAERAEQHSEHISKLSSGQVQANNVEPVRAAVVDGVADSGFATVADTIFEYPAIGSVSVAATGAPKNALTSDVPARTNSQSSVREAPHQSEVSRVAALDVPTDLFPSHLLASTNSIVPIATREMLGAGFAENLVAQLVSYLAADINAIHFSGEGNAQGAPLTEPGVTSVGLSRMPEGVSIGVPAAPSPSSQVSQVAAAETVNVNDVQLILNAFTQAAPQSELIVGARNIVVIDNDIAHLADPHYGVRTWHFDDGSTLSLIGIIPDSGLTI